MISLSSYLLLISILIIKLNAQPRCHDQLYEFYRSVGLPNNVSVVIPVVNLTSGIVGGQSYVDAIYLFQQVARYYQTQIDNGSTVNADNVYINGISVDIPWCTTQIDITCAANVVYCCIGKPNCSTLNDFDQGGSSGVGGRMFIYPDQSSPCNGIVMVRFWDTFITAFSPSSYNEYTYDNHGLLNYTVPTYSPTNVPTPFPTESPTEAPTKSPTKAPTNVPTKAPTKVPTGVPTIVPSSPTGFPTTFPTGFPTVSPTGFPTNSPTAFPTNSPTISPTSAPTSVLTAALSFFDAELEYRFSTCLFNNGSAIFALNQSLYRCADDQITCPARFNGIPTKNNFALASYACTTDPTNSTPAQIIWQMNSVATLNTIDGFFGLSFSLNNLPIASVPQYQNQLIVSGTRRQYKSQYGSLNQIATVFFPPFNNNNNNVQFSPLYLYTLDPIIRVLPCICGFSVDCDENGNIELAEVVISAFAPRNNTIPTCNALTPLVVPLVTNNITLNGTASVDTDGPTPLTFFWRIWQQPLFSPPVIIPNATSPENIVDSSNFIAGVYAFVLYVSDGLNVPVFCFQNFTFQPNIITAITALDFTVGILPCSGGFSTFIPLNGTLSWETNTNFTLFYQWEQFLGWNVLPNTFDSSCGNYTHALFFPNSPLAYFVTDHIGLFAFNLTVTDGITTSSDTIYIHVVPLTINNASQPIPLPNFTLPPIRNFSHPPRPVINFTYFPTSASPTAPTPPTPPTVPTPVPTPTAAPTGNATNTTNTTVADLFPQYPPPTKIQQFIMIFFWFTMLLLLVLFAGIWISEGPFEKKNFFDRKRYFFF